MTFLFIDCNPQPENILLFSPGPYPRVLIADFGLARPNSYQETFNVCGTVSYLPPEGILALDNKHLSYTGSELGKNSLFFLLIFFCSDYHLIAGVSEWFSISCCRTLTVLPSEVGNLGPCPFQSASGSHPFDTEPVTTQSSNWLSYAAATQNSRNVLLMAR